MNTSNLKDKKVVIAGGTGSVGEGIVREYLKSGAEVIVPTYNTFEKADKFAEEVENEFGAIDHVVSTIGGWWSGGAIWETTQKEWDTYFYEFATSHLAMAKSWIPRLSETGSYQIIVGASAIYPVKGSGIVSMQQAALLMMGKVIAEEAGNQRRILLIY